MARGGRSFRGKCVILTCGENVKAVTEYHNLSGGGICGRVLYFCLKAKLQVKFTIF